MKKHIVSTVSKILAAVLVFTLFSCALTSVSAESTVYDFEDYTYANGKDNRTDVLLNCELSEDVALSGEKSMHAIGGASAKAAYFAVGTGSAASTQCKVEKGKKYLLTFSYYLEKALSADTTVKAVYASYSSRTSGVSLNSDKYKIVITADTPAGKWISVTALLDTGGIGKTGGEYLYLSLSGMNADTSVYFDDVTVEEITSSAYIISDPKGYINTAIKGTAGQTAEITVPAAAVNDGFEGLFSDTGKTASAETSRRTEGGNVVITVTFPSAPALIYACYKVEMKYGFENYGFKNNVGAKISMLSNCEVSTEQAYSGSKSMKITDKSASFILGNGSTTEGEASAELGKNYLVTFKYMVTGEPGEVINFGAAFAKADSRWYSPTANIYTYAISGASVTRNVWLNGAFVLETKNVANTLSHYIYIVAAGVKGMYLDDFEITEMASDEFAAVVYNLRNTSTAAAYIGKSSGGALIPAAAGNDSYVFDGFYYENGFFNTLKTVTQDGVKYYKAEKGLLQTEVFAKYTENNVFLGFETYKRDFYFDKYPEYASMDTDYEIAEGVASTGNDSTVYEGTASLHRVGEDKYFRNAMLLGAVQPLVTGEYYTVSMRIKMDKYKQTAGAVKLLRNGSSTYPWTPASCTQSEWIADYKNDYLPVVAVSTLADGVWHRVEISFCATAPYIAVQTPGWCSIYIDSVNFERLETPFVSPAPDFAEYTPADLEDADFIEANVDKNALGFENYPYSYDKTAVSFVTDAAAGKKAAYFTNENAVMLKKVKHGELYKITLSYKGNNDGSISFFTAGEKGENVTEYTLTGQYLEYSASNTYRTATFYITPDLSYSVLKNGYEKTENRTVTYGDTLYVKASAGTYLDGITVTPVENAVTGEGSSILTDNAFLTVGKQAIRVYFAYNSADAATVLFNGKTCTVKERGAVIKEGDNVGRKVSGDYTYKGGVKDARIFTKTENFTEVWKAEGEKITYSFYVTGLKEDDIRNLSSFGYMLLEDESGNRFTVCSASDSINVVRAKEYLEIDSAGDKNTIGGVSFNNYRIILPQHHSYLYTEAAEDLIEYFASVGVTVTVQNDKRVAATSKEIIIGDTTRSESQGEQFRSDDEYVIRGVGGKLVFSGGSELSTYGAVEKALSIMKAYTARGKGVAFPKNSVYLRGEYVGDDYSYKLTFDDEFDGSVINQKIWLNYASNSISWSPGGNSLGGKSYVATPEDNAEVTVYGTGERIKPLRQADGKLELTTAHITKRWKNGEALETGQNDTVNSQAATIRTVLLNGGIIEFGAKLGENHVYTTFWINGDTSAIRSSHPDHARTAFTEYDVIETFGYGAYLAPNIHKWWSAEYNGYSHNSLDYESSDGYCHYNYKNLMGSKLKDYFFDGESVFNSYHIYTLARYPDSTEFAVDGKVFYHYDYKEHTGTSIEDLMNFFILSAGFSSSYNADTDPVKSTTYMDYVRVYQNKSLNQKIEYFNK